MLGTWARAGWRGHALVAAGVAILLAFVALNGGPTVFTDTDDYWSQGADLASDALKLVTGHDYHLGPFSDDPAQDAADAHMGRLQMGARAWTYSVFLYPIERVTTLWTLTAIQALFAVALLWRLWRRFAGGAPGWAFLAFMAVLGAVSTLPIFAGFAMPDVLAGVTLLALLALMTTRPAPWIVALLIFCLSAHTTHQLVLAVLLAAIALAWRRLDRRARRGLGWATGALLAAIVLGAGYAAGVKLNTGETLRRPPFLLARVLADGPGREYLPIACRDPQALAICRFRHQPLLSSEDVLWSDMPGIGVFNLSLYDTRLRLELEETRFVVPAVLHDPLGQLTASLRNFARQLVMVNVDEPEKDPHFYLTDDYWGITELPGMLARTHDCGPKHDRCLPVLRPEASRLWHGGWLLAAFAVLAVLGWRGRRDRLVTGTIALAAAAYVLNAGVCGVLSGPFPRYQARVAWVVPALTGILMARRRWGVDISPPGR